MVPRWQASRLHLTDGNLRWDSYDDRRRFRRRSRATGSGTIPLMAEAATDPIDFIEFVDHFVNHTKYDHYNETTCGAGNTKLHRLTHRRLTDGVRPQLIISVAS